MSFWIRGNQAGKGDANGEHGSQSKIKRKDEKKTSQVKRFDNLRITHQLPVVIRSVGTRADFSFVTKDLSVSGAFVKCDKMHSYPFQISSTILECEVDLGPQSNPPHAKVEFLSRIARVVEVVGGGQNEELGFGIRIVQISPEHRMLLENYVSMHGTVDGSIPFDIGARSDDNSTESAGGVGELMADAS